MDLLRYALISITSFLGIFIGILISNFAIEEIKGARKYLRYLNIILIPLIIFVATFGLHKTYSVLFTLIVFTLLILAKDRYNDSWVYAGMGALLFVSTISQEILNVASMIFIYGISISTVDASTHFKKQINGQIKHSENIALIKKTFSKYSYYLLVSLIFFVSFVYLFKFQ